MFDYASWKLGRLALGAVLMSVALAGCSKKDESSNEAPVDNAAAEGEAPAAEAPEPAEAEPEAKPVELVEHDLAPADPSWEGWVGKGPASAKVMADGVKAARIASNGRPGSEDLEEFFDVRWSPGKRDLAAYKEALKKGEANSKGKMKLTFVTDEPGMLEWKTEAYGTTSHAFFQHMQVEGKDFTCSNNPMVGIQNPERLQQHKDACKTLAKKQ